MYQGNSMKYNSMNDPVQDIAAEDALLATILIQGEKAFQKIECNLQPNDFYETKNKLLF
ncbi:MAG: hypothetical protein KAR45_02845, partial [Desulfobacteraceae bacterium]|nr:hypothetical protein [Desulfobacteraceae bacterium]